MEHVAVRGARLAVERVGGGGAFVWAHGLTSSRRDEDRGRLFDWGERIRYDARSHGESEASTDPADHRWPSLALDLLALAHAVGLTRFRAGGASMGAATVLHAAVAAPERIDRLVLAIPPTAWETRAAQAALYRGGADVVEQQGLAALAELVAARPVPALLADEPALTAFAPDVAEAVLPAVLRGAADSDLPAPDALRSLEAPALVLAWDTDPGHPVATAEALADLLPGAELEVARTLASVRAWPARVAAFLGG